MAVLKPVNPTVNYEEAWKELEKDIKSLGGFDLYHTVSIHMKKLKEKHNNMITLKKRSNPEIVDYCIKKSVEARMENIHLKKELREFKGSNPRLKQKIKISNAKYGKDTKQCMRFLNDIEKILYKRNTTYNIDTGIKHIEFSNTDRYILDRILELKILMPEKMSKRKLFDIHLICVTKDDLEFTFDWHVTEKKLNYLDTAFKERNDISWHGLKMRIVDLKISYPGEGKNNE